MTPLAAITLFFVMLALASIPSASVALVVTRSATLGVKNGSAVAAGIVLGDLLFIALAMVGMSVLAETMGTFFAILKYVGGSYLIWIGIGLIRSKHETVLHPADSRKSTLFASLLSGFVLTLGDVKAILFYASLFPTFVDMASLTGIDVATISIITIVAVGGVKVGYALAARRIVLRLKKQRTQRVVRSAAGGLMIGTGTYLIAKA